MPSQTKISIHIGLTEFNLLELDRARSLLESEFNRTYKVNQVLEIVFRSFFDDQNKKMLRELHGEFSDYIKLSRSQKRPIWVTVDFIESTIKAAMQKWLLLKTEEINEFWHETKQEFEALYDCSIDYTQYHEYGIVCNTVVLEGEQE